MVTFTQPIRSAFHDSRSGGQWSTIGSFEHFDQKGSSRRDTFVVSQDTAERLVADNLLVLGEWLVFVGPFSRKWSVLQGLMGTKLVVEADIRSNEMIEVLFAKNHEETQALNFDTLYPSFDESILIGRSRCRWLNTTANIFEQLIKFSDVHAIAVTDKILDSQVNFAGLLDKSMSLANHPLGIGLETAGRADHSASADMNKRQDKRLPQAGWSPDHLAEEVYLPERIDVGLKELVPGPRTTLGTRLDALFLEDVLDCRLRDASDAEFSQFSENPVVAPASFTSETDDDFSNRFQSACSDHHLWVFPTVFLANPALVRARMDNDNRFVGTGAEFCSQLEQSFFLLLLQEDPLFGNQLASHHELFFEDLILSAQFVFRVPCKIEQKRRKPTCHERIPIVTDEVEKSDDNLFTPLQSTNGRPPCPAKLPIDVRACQSMKTGDNCFWQAWV